MPIKFLSPGAKQEVVLFWRQMKAHIFLIISPKFQLQIHNILLKLQQKNATISGIPILILCIFIKVSSHVSKY